MNIKGFTKTEILSIRKTRLVFEGVFLRGDSSRPRVGRTSPQYVSFLPTGLYPLRGRPISTARCKDDIVVKSPASLEKSDGRSILYKGALSRRRHTGDPWTPTSNNRCSHTVLKTPNPVPTTGVVSFLSVLFRTTFLYTEPDGQLWSVDRGKWARLW